MIAIWFEAVYSSILYHWLDSWGVPPSDKPVAPSVTMHCGLQNQTDINYYSIKFNDPLKKSIQVKVSIWPTRLPHHICRTIQICNFLVFHYPTLPVKKKNQISHTWFWSLGCFFSNGIRISYTFTQCNSNQLSAEKSVRISNHVTLARGVALTWTIPLSSTLNMTPELPSPPSCDPHSQSVPTKELDLDFFTLFQL